MTTILAPPYCVFTLYKKKLIKNGYVQKLKATLIACDFLRAPKLLNRLKCEYEMKTMKKQGIEARSLVRNISKVEGCDGAPRWD
jgi:hypothetical protein